MSFICLFLIIITVNIEPVLAQDKVSDDLGTKMKILSSRIMSAKTHKAMRLIGNIPEDQRTTFVEQILKLSQKSPEGSTGLEILNILLKTSIDEREDAVNQYLRLMEADATASIPFAKSFKIISKVPTPYRSLFVDQVLRFVRPPMTLAQQFGIISVLHQVPYAEQVDFIDQTLRLITPDEMTHENVLQTARALCRLSLDIRHQFVDFILTNEAPNTRQMLDHINTSVEDWEESLRVFRNVDEIPEDYSVQHILGLRNQTIHDEIYEASLNVAVLKLSDRYPTPAPLLKIIQGFYLEKIDDLLSKKLLSETEAQIVRHFFKTGMKRLAVNRHRITQYLHLSWQALTDKAMAKNLGLKADFNDKDIDDRIVGWLKAGPMDAQLAYLLDQLGDRYKTKCALLEAIPQNPSLLTEGQSCIGGSYNRLIDGLHLVHPDVVLALGEGHKKNIELMARLHFLRKQAVAFLTKRYEEDSGLFDNSEDLKQKTHQHLTKCLEIEVKESYPALLPEIAEHELEQYFQDYFEEDTTKATPARPVQDYIHNWEKGLLKDLQTWIEENPALTFELTLKGLENQTNSLMRSKLDTLSNPVSETLKADMIAQANQMAKMKAVRHRVHVFQTLALSVMDQVPTGPTTAYVKTLLVDLVVKELLKTQPNAETYRVEIRETILGDGNVNDILHSKVV